MREGSVISLQGLGLLRVGLLAWSCLTSMPGKAMVVGPAKDLSCLFCVTSWILTGRCSRSVCSERWRSVETL